MVGSPPIFHLTRYIVLVLVLFSFVFPCLRSHSPAYVRDNYAEFLATFEHDKKLFVADFLRNEVGGDEDGSALAKLCASKTWFPESQDIILSCEPVPGGIGQVKNGQLNCIRFAIEIGAQLILPCMIQRSASDLSNLQDSRSSKGLSIDYMFSTPHLTTSLRTHCPQLQVHDSLDALYDKPSLLTALPISLGELSSDNATVDDIPTTVLADPAPLRPRFLAALAQRPPVETRRYPVRVHLAPVLFAWPTLHEPAGLRADFGRLLRARDDARALAASALWNMAARHAVALLGPRMARDGGAAAAAGAGFVGVHLRTESDAREGRGGFPEYGDQAAYFFDFLQNRTTPSSSSASSSLAASDGASSSSSSSSSNNGAPVVFLATGLTGIDDDVRRFRHRAAALGAARAVLLKRDLLDAAEVGVLDALSWDQRALVDYENMLRAGAVLGVVESYFAWAVALRRAAAYGGRAEAAAEAAAAGPSFRARPGGEAFAAGT